MKIKIKGKVFDVKKCDNVFSQSLGLMFRKDSLPLLFIFKNKKKRAIHSFFCKPFIAIWFDDNRIIDEKLVKPFCVSIKPKEKFNKLLEIPSNNNGFNELLSDLSRERKV